MTARVLVGPPHDCKTDGHLIALRLRRDPADTAVSVTPFCELCRMMFLPPSGMDGWLADWLMKQVERAQFAPPGPPEAYEGL